jgi:hypothetical protein
MPWMRTPPPSANVGKPVVVCNDAEAVQRPELICLITSVGRKIAAAQPWAMLLPWEMREEFDGIVARMLPSDLEEALDGLSAPDPDTLAEWLEHLARS